MTDFEKKPRLRFKGFTEAWEQRRLKEVVSRIATGLNPRDNFVLNKGGKNYYVTIKNFDHSHLYLDDDCDRIDDEALMKIQARSDLKINDILFTSIGRIGDCYLIKKQPVNWNINESVFTLRPNKNEVEPEYLFHVIHSERVLNQILSNITGSTFKSIKIGDLKKAVVAITNKSEQFKLAKFITELDDIITLHQRKCEKLKSMKKALLEKMFPSGDETSPKIRFKGFTEAWEQRSAKELCSITTGKSNTQDQVDDGKYQFYIRSDMPVKSNKFLFDEEAVITIGDGNIGKVFHYVNGKFDLHQRCYKMANFSYVSAKYFYWYFSTKFYKRAISMTAKATVDSVRLEMISDMPIKYPENKDEQSKISSFLFQLDSLITLHQRKCEKLKKLKKSLLERMFI